MSHLLAIVSFLLLHLLLAHDIHVSIGEIEVKEERIELVLKTFIDDLQIAVGLTPGEELPEDYTSADDLIEAYLTESYILTLDETVLIPIIEDISASPDAVWITIIFDKADLSDVNKLEIQSTFLTEVYDDQTNLIKVQTEEGLTTKLLNKQKTSLQIEL